MGDVKQTVDGFLDKLLENDRELKCLFEIEKALNKENREPEEIFRKILKILPKGFQYPEFCFAEIVIDDVTYNLTEAKITEWKYESEIDIHNTKIGSLTVYYTKKLPIADNGPFLNDEIQLIRTVTDRLADYLLSTSLNKIFSNKSFIKKGTANNCEKSEWRIVLEMLRKTDPNMFMKILRKLLYNLLWNNVEGAERLIQLSVIDNTLGDVDNVMGKEDENRPLRKRIINNYDEYIFAILKLAEENIPDEQIYSRLQKWIQDYKAGGLVKAVESLDTSLTDISDAIRKYYHIAPEKFELDMATIKSLRVSLIRRFFTDQLEYISIAKEFVKLTDFYHLIHKMIFSPHSHGKLGGKSAGLWLASHILRKCSEESDLLGNVKTPKTWFIASDAIMHFMQYNDLEEVLTQKHKDIDEIRVEYPHIIQVFKNSEFPPNMVKGLSMALDDLGDKPLIVRSSSLMEDQMGQSFSGKYKSLFLANQGPKEERLTALMDAVAEVYASTFAPDPLEYRTERGLIDFHEEMGIMIQEVVGKKVGRYFLPSFAGVAFSKNEFRWSSRIKRDDGLVRLVPGLGTRAVDRLSDDYPVLIAPGQPNLRVNVTVKDMVRYSPKYIDVINLELNQFESIEINDLLQTIEDEYPGAQNVVSVFDGQMMRQPGFDTDFTKDHLVCTFDGLFTKTNFIKRLREILNKLEEKIKSPVDIEFAHDGKDFYLLQCRPQSYFGENTSDPIPRDIPDEKVIFSANKYVSNGTVPEISYIVYVDPDEYGKIESLEKLKEVGRAVGKLNKILPRREFILMGPGRWGSRGDIKLGVSVTYSDINNTAMLVEIARNKGGYVPDLSFGTHFFQDLVEADIQYLPLYPDEKGILFNNRFFEVSENKISDILKEYSDLENVIKVINVKESTNGNILKVLLNADLDEAISVIVKPGSEDVASELSKDSEKSGKRDFVSQSKWRQNMAERIAASLDVNEYGVEAIYLFGSSKNITAEKQSDINLIVKLKENYKEDKLRNYLNGWSNALTEMNFQRTGYMQENMLDVHFISEEDIKNETKYAKKLKRVDNPPRKLKLKNQY